MSTEKETEPPNEKVVAVSRNVHRIVFPLRSEIKSLHAVLMFHGNNVSETALNSSCLVYEYALSNLSVSMRGI